MAGPYGLKDGTEYLPKYNHEPGMNDEVAHSDRAGWQTSVAMLTGGVTMDFGDLGSLEVGGAYDLDPMGEERTMTTFSESDPRALGLIGQARTESAGMQGTQTTVGGKRVNLSSPQTYNTVDQAKK